jgi:hypothetical protein
MEARKEREKQMFCEYCQRNVNVDLYDEVLL